MLRVAASRVLDRGEQRVDPLPGHGRDQEARPLRRPAGGDVRAGSRAPSGSKRSILFQTSRMRAPASGSMPSWRSTVSTSRCCASASSCEMSRTWRMRSASSTSSSVARKAATSCVGRSEMKPTVSDRIALPPCGRLERAHGRVERREQQVVGQHVGAGQAVEQRRFAGIGVADQRDHAVRHALPRRRAAAAASPAPSPVRSRAARCARRSGGGRPRSGFRRDRRGSRSRRAGARDGSSDRTSRLLW